ncbi:sporulation protein [bacterium]|nr:sporulation protein [bacterium]
MAIEELVKTVLAELKEISQTETVVGKPITVDDMTVIPVSRISMGFGAGGGDMQKSTGRGQGTGGGIAIEPKAFLVLRKNKVDLISLQEGEMTFGKVVELIPQIVNRLKSMKETKKKSAG